MLFELAEPSVGGVARSERLLHLKLPSQFVDNVEELEMNWCKSGCAGFKGRVAEKRGARGCGTSQAHRHQVGDCEMQSEPIAQQASVCALNTFRQQFQNPPRPIGCNIECVFSCSLNKAARSLARVGAAASMSPGASTTTLRAGVTPALIKGRNAGTRRGATPLRAVAYGHVGTHTLTAHAGMGSAPFVG